LLYEDAPRSRSTVLQPESSILCGMRVVLMLMEKISRTSGKMPKIGVMRVLKYLLPLWTGIVVYSIAVVTVGKIGLQAYEELSREREKQQQNLENLKNINENLSGIRDALKYDGDTITVEARGLGYGSKDERFIRIAGPSNVRSSQFSEGELVQIKTSDFIEDTTLRIVAVCVAGMLLLFFLFIDVLKVLSSGKTYNASA
jgi:cell division protein FtsB